MDVAFPENKYNFFNPCSLLCSDRAIFKMQYTQETLFDINPTGFSQREDYFFKLTELLSSNLDFRDQSSRYLSHNFHSFPAKFPPQLPQRFIDELTNPGDIVLDPMAGSGTTIVEAVINNRVGLGFDIDPLALRLTKIKTTPLAADHLIEWGQKLLHNTQRVILSPQLIQNDFDKVYDEETRAFLRHWFLPDTQIELFALSREIEKIPDPATRIFFEIALSAIIITKTGGVSLALDLGHTRPHLAKKVTDKGGNVLFGTPEIDVPKYLSKTARQVLPEFQKRYQQNIAGIITTKDSVQKSCVNYGNAQALPLDNCSVDLIVTSPPYASNAIDYMRAHKFALVWFGYPVKVLSQKRKDYIGGEAVNDFDFAQLPDSVLSVVNMISHKDTRKGYVISRYYSEMTRTIKEMYRVLKPGKAAIVVVGNSMMCGVDAKVPECLAEIGKEIGFEVPAIGIRNLDRDKRMMPAGQNVDISSQIQKRIHEEYVIGYYRPEGDIFVTT